MPLCGLDSSLGESPDPELHVHTDSSLRSSVSPSAVGTPRGFNKLSSEMSRADKQAENEDRRFKETRDNE